MRRQPGTEAGSNLELCLGLGGSATDRDMKHHTVSATFQAPPEEVFAYLADIEKLPEWATEFARELRLVDGHYKVVNGLGEFFFEIQADPDTGVIDMFAG